MSVVKKIRTFFDSMHPDEIRLLFLGLDNGFATEAKNGKIVQKFDIEFKKYLELLNIIKDNENEILIAYCANNPELRTYGDFAKYIINIERRGFRKHY